MKRPEHLPEYTDPPLHEVVLGVQFAPVPAYTSVYAMNIWELFKAEFPKPQELPILHPQFETFGGTNVQIGSPLIVGASPVGSRLWFVSEDETHLLQFQADRFISNWRREPNTQPYPRFEGLAEAFRANLAKLANHFASDFSYQIKINQVEISYVNIIPVETFSQVGNWFNLWKGEGFDIEGLFADFSEVRRDQDGKPFARLHHQLRSVFTHDGKHKAFSLSLALRGKPSSSSIDAAMNFLATGREAIVSRFGEITTAEAQKSWGRME